MEENDVKSIYGGTKLEFKIEEDEKTLIYNLTHCNFFNQSLITRKKIISKSYAL